MGTTLSSDIDNDQLAQLQKSTVFSREEVLALYSQFRFLADNRKTISRHEFEVAMRSCGLSAVSAAKAPPGVPAPKSPFPQFGVLAAESQQDPLANSGGPFTLSPPSQALAPTSQSLAMATVQPPAAAITNVKVTPRPNFGASATGSDPAASQTNSSSLSSSQPTSSQPSTTSPIVAGVHSGRIATPPPAPNRTPRPGNVSPSALPSSRSFTGGGTPGAVASPSSVSLMFPTTRPSAAAVSHHLPPLSPQRGVAGGVANPPIAVAGAVGASILTSPAPSKMDAAGSLVVGALSSLGSSGMPPPSPKNLQLDDKHSGAGIASAIGAHGALGASVTAIGSSTTSLPGQGPPGASQSLGINGSSLGSRSSSVSSDRRMSNSGRISGESSVNVQTPAVETPPAHSPSHTQLTNPMPATGSPPTQATGGALRPTPLAAVALAGALVAPASPSAARTALQALTTTQPLSAHAVGLTALSAAPSAGTPKSGSGAKSTPVSGPAGAAAIRRASVNSLGSAASLSPSQLGLQLHGGNFDNFRGATAAAAAPIVDEQDQKEEFERLVLRLFDVMAGGPDKKVNFEDFCAALSAFASPNLEDLLDVVFRLFNEDGDDYITEDELRRALISLTMVFSLEELALVTSPGESQTQHPGLGQSQNPRRLSLQSRNSQTLDQPGFVSIDATPTTTPPQPHHEHAGASSVFHPSTSAIGPPPERKASGTSVLLKESPQERVDVRRPGHGQSVTPPPAQVSQSAPLIGAVISSTVTSGVFGSSVEVGMLERQTSAGSSSYSPPPDARESKLPSVTLLESSVKGPKEVARSRLTQALTVPFSVTNVPGVTCVPLLAQYLQESVENHPNPEAVVGTLSPVQLGDINALSFPPHGGGGGAGGSPNRGKDRRVSDLMLPNLGDPADGGNRNASPLSPSESFGLGLTSGAGFPMDLWQSPATKALGQRDQTAAEARERNAAKWAKVLIARHDLNDDRRLNYAEFCAAVRSHPELALAAKKLVTGVCADFFHVSTGRSMSLCAGCGTVAADSDDSTAGSDSRPSAQSRSPGRNGGAGTKKRRRLVGKDDASSVATADGTKPFHFHSGQNDIDLETNVLTHVACVAYPQSRDDVLAVLAQALGVTGRKHPAVAAAAPPQLSIVVGTDTAANGPPISAAQGVAPGDQLDEYDIMSVLGGAEDLPPPKPASSRGRGRASPRDRMMRGRGAGGRGGAGSKVDDQSGNNGPIQRQETATPPHQASTVRGHDTSELSSCDNDTLTDDDDEDSEMEDRLARTIHSSAWDDVPDELLPINTGAVLDRIFLLIFVEDPTATGSEQNVAAAVQRAHESFLSLVPPGVCVGLAVDVAPKQRAAEEVRDKCLRYAQANRANVLLLPGTIGVHEGGELLSQFSDFAVVVGRPFGNIAPLRSAPDPTAPVQNHPKARGSPRRRRSTSALAMTSEEKHERAIRDKQREIERNFEMHMMSGAGSTVSTSATSKTMPAFALSASALPNGMALGAGQGISVASDTGMSSGPNRNPGATPRKGSTEAKSSPKDEKLTPRGTLSPNGTPPERPLLDGPAFSPQTQGFALGPGDAMSTPGRVMRTIHLCVDTCKASHRAAELVGRALDYDAKDLVIVETLWSCDLAVSDDAGSQTPTRRKQMQARSVEVADTYRQRVIDAAFRARGISPNVKSVAGDAIRRCVAVGSHQQQSWESRVASNVAQAAATATMDGGTLHHTTVVCAFPSKALGSRLFAKLMPAVAAHSAHTAGHHGRHALKKRVAPEACLGWMSVN